jgi:hypothetical protein
MSGCQRDRGESELLAGVDDGLAAGRWGQREDRRGHRNGDLECRTAA